MKLNLIKTLAEPYCVTLSALVCTTLGHSESPKKHLHTQNQNKTDSEICQSILTFNLLDIQENQMSQTEQTIIRPNIPAEVRYYTFYAH